MIDFSQASVRFFGGVFIAVCTGLTAVPADAAEVKVLTAGAMKAVILALVPDFEKQTGHKVVIDNDTAGGLAKRIGAGETFDLAVITPRVIDDLVAQGKIAAPSKTILAKVGIGVAVKEGAAKPDIATVEAFKQTLLKAKSVAYIDPKAGGSSGIYFDSLIEKMGIASEVRGKAKLKAGGYVADLVANGEAEIAVHQISEIVPVQGVTLVGPLPAAVQNITIYTAGISATARDAAATKALLDVLAGPAAAPVLASKGMEKP